MENSIKNTINTRFVITIIALINILFYTVSCSQTQSSVGTQSGQQSSSGTNKQAAPLTKEEEEISKVYLAKCAKCHGEHGLPSLPNMMKAADLTRPEAHKLSDDQIKEIILKGRDKMPRIKGIDDAEALKLARYIRRFKS